MKRIAHLLTIAAVLLGILLLMPRRALAANQYPTAAEVYVSGQPMSEYTGNHASYDASTGTLTLTNRVNGIEVRSDRGIPLDLNIVVDGRVHVYARSTQEWSYPRLVGIANNTGSGSSRGNLNISLTAGSELHVNCVTADEAGDANRHLTEAAGISCDGRVTLTGAAGSKYSVYVRTDWYVQQDGQSTLTNAPNLPTTGISAGGGLYIEGDASGNVRVQNHGAVTGMSYCTRAVRVFSGAQINIGGTSNWTFDTSSCFGANISAVFYIDAAAPNLTVASTVGEVTFKTCGNPELGKFILQNDGREYGTDTLPEINQHVLEISQSSARYKADGRAIITTTEIKLNELPALGTQGSITAENIVLDLGISDPRYTLNKGYWWYKLPDSDTWHTLGTNQFLPTDATAVRVSFSLLAAEGYRFSYGTDVIARITNSAGTGLRHTTERAYMYPANTPSSGTFYIDLQLSDIADQHPIEAAEVWGVRAPHNGNQVYVETGQSSTHGQIPANAYRYYAWATLGQWGTRPGNQYWTQIDPRSGAELRTLTPSDTFQAGEQYRWHGILYAKPGWKFTEDTLITFNDGNVVGHTISADGKLLDLFYTYSCPTLSISKVAVLDQTEPVAGETPVIDGTVPDDAAYSITAGESYWYEGRLNSSNSYQLNSLTPFTGTFQADTWYSYIVCIEPDRANGYGFNHYLSDSDIISSNVDASINGLGLGGGMFGRYFSSGQSDGRGKIFLCRPFYCTNPDAIDRIDIQQTMPVAGQTALGDATSLTPDVTTIAPDPELLAQFQDIGIDTSRVPANATSLWMGQLFIGEDDDINPNALMPVFENSTAGINRTYVLSVRVRAENGSVFAMGGNGVSDTRAYVEGVPASVQLSDDRTEATITLTYTMPWAGDTSHKLFVPTGVVVQRMLDDGSWIQWSPDEVDYSYTGYDLYSSADEGTRFRVQTYWPSTWKAPANEEFYKWISPSDDVVFEEDIRRGHTIFTMPAHDTTIDILTQREGTLPIPFNSSFISGYTTSEGWADPESLSWAFFNGSTQYREAILVDDKGTSDTSDDYTLVKGVDYTSTYEPAAGADAGGYTITYTGIPGPRNEGGYEGSFTTSYSIDPVNISTCEMTLNTAHADEPANPGDDPVWWEYYTGEEIEPSYTITLGDYTLVEGTDYDLEYYYNTDVGPTQARVIGKGNFSGWDYRYFEIRPRDISDLTITPPSDVTFNGHYQYPPVTVTCDGATLEEGTDYYTSYANNFDAGTASVTVTGNASAGWVGSREFEFQILPINLSDSTIEWNELGARHYTGSEIRPLDDTGITVGYHSTAGTLRTGTEVAVTSYEDNVYPGEATVTIEGTGNYTGTYDLTFDIYAYLDNSYMSYGDIDSEYTPTPGQPLEPKPTVSIDGHELVAGTDYKLVYENNTAAGATGRVYVRAVDGARFYLGEQYFEFAINALDLGNASIAEIPSQAYTGSAVEPGITVTYDGVTLTSGTDYTVAYSNNVDLGTATVTITGTGFFEGTKTATFKIVSSISGAKVSASNVTYNGSAQKPAVTVTLGGKTLKSGTDYTVAYKNNTNAGTATITVTGKGNYAGTATGTFKINAASIADATVSADDQTYTGSALKPAVTVTLGGKTLKSGTDYTVAYKNNTNAGTATITVTGKGNYTGTATGTFEITVSTFESPFIDVTEKTDHADDINWMYYSGVSMGWEVAAGREYRPYWDVARADMAAFLYRLAGSPAYTPTEAEKTAFVDVNEKTPHAIEIWWLASTGISTGFPDHTFRPYDTVARCDMAAFLYRLAGSPAYTPSSADQAKFWDVNEGTPHAVEIWWLASTGVSTGFPNGSFGVYGNVARCDMAAFMHRMYDKGLVKTSW